MSNTEVTAEDLKKLLAREKKVAEDRMKAFAKTQCTLEAKNLRDCTHGKFLSVAWDCRAVLKELNNCLNQYTNEEHRKKFQTEYILEKRQRQQKAEN